jgi:predicted secreted protein
MDKDDQTPSEPQDPENSHGLRNILKLIFLAAALTGAWFLLDRLISGK